MFVGEQRGGLNLGNLTRHTFDSFHTIFWFIKANQTHSVQEKKLCTSLEHHGGFQLEFVNISRVMNHMTCYNSSALIG